MVELYGPAFTSAYGDAPSHLWLAAISELTDEQCKLGLVTLAKQAREYPANLTQFMAACRPQGSPRYLGRPMTSTELHKQLDVKKAAPETAAKYIEKMRRRLGLSKESA